MDGISIIIPALNEEKAIEEVLNGIFAHMRSGREPFEVIVVDDGSTDKTGELAKSLGAQVIRHPVSGGYGLSLRDGILNAKHERIVIIDADGTYPAERIRDLADDLKDFDMVIGARDIKKTHESFFKFFSRHILRKLCEFVAGVRIPDVNSGLRAFRKSRVLQFRDTFCLGFSFTTTITLAFHLNGMFVKYTPIEYFKRKAGRPHVRFIKDSLRTAQIVTQAILYYNPIKLFLLLSFMFLGLAGLCLTAYYFNESHAGLWFGGMSFLAAVILFGMGLMTEAARVTGRKWS